MLFCFKKKDITIIDMHSDVIWEVLQTLKQILTAFKPTLPELGGEGMAVWEILLSNGSAIMTFLKGNFAIFVYFKHKNM